MISKVRKIGTEFYWNYNDNRYYGHLDALKNYCNKKYTFGIPGLLQHGWTLGPGIYPSISQDLEYNFFVWNIRNYNIATELGYNNVIPIGSPFLYLPFHQITETNQNEKNNNLLVFPHHAWEKEGFLDPIAFFKDYVEDLKKIKTNFDNVVACLYFMEYKNMAIRELFEKNNIRTITMGYRNNQNFLLNIVSTMNEFEYISSNTISTAIFYGLYMDKKVFIYGSRPDKSKTNWNSETVKLFENLQSIYEKYYYLNWEYFDDKTHIEIGKIELGHHYKKTIDELKKIFGWV